MVHHANLTNFANHANTSETGITNQISTMPTMQLDAVGADPGSDGPITWDDATWILTSAFIIFTMQSGFGLLEAGSVSVKNEVNIMVKNAVDVIFGGITYWLFGFGISFGMDPGTNGFNGVGYFLLDSENDQMGVVFSTFVFQLSFATTATTIVSGAMAERTKLTSYILYSFVNTVVYVFPAHWIWADNGFLHALGVVDIAGSGTVHLVGGSSAIVAACLLGPRIGRYDKGYEPPQMGNPANTMIGMFMLWWGWLGFNCGSTFGISKGKWVLASKAAVTTLNASMGGGAVGIISSYFLKKGKYDVSFLVNSILGALVGVTASCAVIRAWEAFIIGGIGAAATLSSMHLMDRIKIDDPVGAISVHGIGGIWGMLAVGLFVDVDKFQNMTRGGVGLFHGGGFYLLGVQVLACVVMASWSACISFLTLFTLRCTIGIRLTAEEELLGADYVEHGIEPDMGTSVLFQSRRCSSISIRRSTVRALSQNKLNAVNECTLSKNMVDGVKRATEGTTHLALPSISGAMDNGAMEYGLIEESNNVVDNGQCSNSVHPGTG